MKHGGQKAGRNLLAAIFHNGFTGTVVKCDVTALPRLASRRTGMPRAWPISKTLSMNCLPFIVLNIGQICPNIKKKMGQIFSWRLSKALRGTRAISSKTRIPRKSSWPFVPFTEVNR